jgi:DNA-binding CsgD family transcriptional regulator
MAIKIALDHPTITLKTKIQELCSDFFATYGLNYFQYLRCYADGSIGLLTNHTGLIEHFQYVDNTPVVFSSFDEEHQNAPSYWFLWDEELPEMPVQLAREKFNLRNGITLVKRSKNYYDMIAVTSPIEPTNSGAFYLNKLKAIEQFINEFDIKNKELIKIMDDNPILLPEPCRDINYQKICLTQGKIAVLGKEGMTYITVQELACSRLFVKGMSYKNIALILEISHRTVETYLQRVKQRTKCFSRTELEQIIPL